MTQDDYLARIDQRLESLVNQIGQLLEYLHTDSTATRAAVFGLSQHLQESDDRMERIENAIERQTAIADKQADSVRQLIEMLNRRQA